MHVGTVLVLASTKLVRFVAMCFHSNASGACGWIKLPRYSSVQSSGVYLVAPTIMLRVLFSSLQQSQVTVPRLFCPKIGDWPQHMTKRLGQLVNKSR